MKITYLLGAGASYNALPIINDFRQYMLLTHNRLKFIFENYDKSLKEVIQLNEREIYIFNEININTNVKNNLLQFNEDILYYYNETISFRSIDTYAKYLYITDNEKKVQYKKFKVFLSVYFVLFQDLFFNFTQQKFSKIDNRYKDLLINLMSTQIIPDNVKVLTWNYDFQFQIALNSFFDSTKNKVETFYSEHKKGFDYNNETFLYNLNGIANNFVDESFYYNNKIGETHNYYQYYYCIENILKLYIQNPIQILDSIKYAWENKDFDNFTNDIQEHLSETTHLVIIGYSFPFTNRHLDKKLINSLSIRSIKEITFQNIIDLNDKESLFDFFNTQTKNTFLKNYKFINNTETFYIPFDYNL